MSNQKKVGDLTPVQFITLAKKIASKWDDVAAYLNIERSDVTIMLPRSSAPYDYSIQLLTQVKEEGKCTLADLATAMIKAGLAGYVTQDIFMK